MTTSNHARISTSLTDVTSPACLKPLARGYGGGVANYRDEVTLPPHLDPENAEAVLGVLERHPFDEAGQGLLIRRWTLTRARLAHGGSL
jgi:hypothetical protein